MSNRSRWERKQRREVWPPSPSSKAGALHRRVLRIWSQPSYLNGLGKNTFIHNGGKP